MALTSKWGIYSDDPGMLALGNTQDTRQADSIEKALDAAVEAASFVKSQLLGGSLTGDTAGAGVFSASNVVAATDAGMPDPYPGILVSYPVGSSGGHQSYISLRGGTWERSKVAGAWGAWGKNGVPAPEALTSSSNLDAISNGVHLVSNIIIARDVAAPDTYPGVIVSYPVGEKGGLQTFTSLRGGSWSRSKVNNVWGPWSSNAGTTTQGTGGGREILRQGLSARKGGVIGTSGRGVIALRFDDAPAEFRAKALQLLQARALPFTRVSTSESIATRQIPAEEFQAMQDYCLSNGGEVWNHGRTHLDANGDALVAEIAGARDALRSAMPRIPIDCFAPPGGSSISYGGHMPSTSASSWDTQAGATILGHHALASGYLPDSYYRPIDGVLRDGQNHYSVDSYDFSRAKQLIDRARDWRVGVVMMWHMNNPGNSGYMSMSDFEATLDYIAAERDAGRILVLTVSGLGLADKGSSYRESLLSKQGSGGAFSESVLYPQFRQGVLGSTRELVARVVGSPGSEVTARVGEGSRVFVIPDGGELSLRYPVTIPLDASSLAVSIDGGSVFDVSFCAV